MSEAETRLLADGPFKKHRWLRYIVTIAVLGCLFFILPLFFPVLIWDGDVHCTFKVKVISEGNSVPIPGAEVRLMLPRDEDFARILSSDEFTAFLKDQQRLVTTDDKGEATLHALLGAGGRSGFFYRSGYYGVSGRLSITHPDYTPCADLLANYLGKSRFPISQKVQIIPLALQHKARSISWERED